MRRRRGVRNVPLIATSASVAALVARSQKRKIRARGVIYYSGSIDLRGLREWRGGRFVRAAGSGANTAVLNAGVTYAGSHGGLDSMTAFESVATIANGATSLDPADWEVDRLPVGRYYLYDPVASITIVGGGTTISLTGEWIEIIDGDGNLAAPIVGVLSQSEYSSGSRLIHEQNLTNIVKSLTIDGVYIDCASQYGVGINVGAGFGNRVRNSRVVNHTTYGVSFGNQKYSRLCNTSFDTTAGTNRYHTYFAKTTFCACCRCYDDQSEAIMLVTGSSNSYWYGIDLTGNHLDIDHGQGGYGNILNGGTFKSMHAGNTAWYAGSEVRFVNVDCTTAGGARVGGFGTVRAYPGGRLILGPGTRADHISCGYIPGTGAALNGVAITGNQGPISIVCENGSTVFCSISPAIAATGINAPYSLPAGGCSIERIQIDRGASLRNTTFQPCIDTRNLTVGEVFLRGSFQVGYDNSSVPVIWFTIPVELTVDGATLTATGTTNARFVRFDSGAAGSQYTYVASTINGTTKTAAQSMNDQTSGQVVIM